MYELWSESKVKDKRTLTRYKLERFCKSTFFRDSYSLSGVLLRVTVSYKPVSQNWSKHLRTPTPYGPSYNGGSGFVASLAWAAKSRWKTSYRYGDENIQYSKINSFIKALKDKKITKIMKTTVDVFVAIAAPVLKVWQWIHQCSLHPERLRLSPGGFKVKKSQTAVPGLISVQRRHPSPHRSLSPVVQMMAKAPRWSTCPIPHVRYHCGGWSEEVNSCILISYMVYNLNRV